MQHANDIPESLRRHVITRRAARIRAWPTAPPGMAFGSRPISTAG